MQKAPIHVYQIYQSIPDRSLFSGITNRIREESWIYQTSNLSPVENEKELPVSGTIDPEMRKRSLVPLPLVTVTQQKK